MPGKRGAGKRDIVKQCNAAQKAADLLVEVREKCLKNAAFAAFFAYWSPSTSIEMAAKASGSSALILLAIWCWKK